MTLRDFRAAGKIELRQAPVPAPPAQARCKGLLPRHEYLPGSCRNDAVRQDAIGGRGETPEIAIGRVDRGVARIGLELPRRDCGCDHPLSRRRCRPNHACHSAMGHRLCVFAADGGLVAGTMAAASRLVCRCHPGGLLLRIVFRPLQHSDRFYDRGPGQPRPGDVAAPYNVWSRPFIQRSSALGFLTVGMGAGAAALILVGSLTGSVAVLRSLSTPQWIASIYLGVGGGALAFILWVMALERATPTRVASTMTVNPIAAGLLATQLVGEPITPNLVVGLAAVFAGIWIATTEVKKP